MENDIYSPSKFLNKISKKNKFYLNTVQSSENELSNLKPHKTSLSTIEDKARINNLANRLRTLLKLPKAHKWVIYEWFYSNLDQPLFCYNAENDFQLCLKEIFPQLKTKNLRRAEWCQIRKLMGKPRRCSQSFLDEERQTLKKKREKIRQIYLNSSIDNLIDFQDLPENITMPLIIGNKVTVLYKKTHEGLFNGKVDAIDLINGSYRISFDKSGFGTENVNDYDIRSVDNAELMPLVAFESKKNRNINNHTSNVKKIYATQKLNEMFEYDMSLNNENQLNLNETNVESSFENLSSQECSNDVSLNSEESFVRFMKKCSLISDSSIKANNNNQSLMSISDEKSIGIYPIKFLAFIINFYKLINKKRSKLNELKSMNTKAELYKSSKLVKIPIEFKNEYAYLILELENINYYLNSILEKISKYINDLKLAKKNNKNSLDEDDFVNKNLGNKNIDDSSKNLITKLVSLLINLKNYVDKGLDVEDLTGINLKIKTIKKDINQKNYKSFEDHIEIHFKHLQCNMNYFDCLSSTKINSKLDAFHNDHL